MKKQSRKRAGRRTAEEIRHLVRKYDESGLTQREFARKLGIGYSTLTYWLRQQRRHDSAPGTNEWIEVPLPPPPTTPAYQVDWPDGSSLRVGRGFDHREVEALLTLLRPTCSR